MITKPAPYHISILLSLFFMLIPSVCSYAETSNTDKLMKYAGNIHQFNSIFQQEKVYLQFDNTSYYTEETIWFKAFVVNASTLKRSESRVLYVDLLSPDGILLKQEKLMIIAGQADGSITLYDGATAQARDLRGGIRGYPSGFYEIRAYTNYMLNFNPEGIFSRVFAVYNKPTQEGHYYDENPTIALGPSNTTPLRPELPKPKDVNVSFYPEGGHLIIGKPCRVAFKVTGNNGLGIEATGSMEEAGITFNTLHDGMGSFTFTPNSARNNIKITALGHTGTYSLPRAEEEGCTVQTAPQDNDSILFNIFASNNFKGSELGMTLTCRGELVNFATIRLKGQDDKYSFPLTSMPEGVIRFSLFDSIGNVLATRSFYHENPSIGVPLLKVQSDKPAYAHFEKIRLSFQLTDSKGTPFRDRFCLSVRDSRGQANTFHDDLRTHLLISSDLKGHIERPSYYFDTTNTERLRDLDLLCMVQGWERYDWRTMAGVDEFTEQHRLETGLTLNGWVMNGSGNKPLSGVEVKAALAPTDKKLTETYSYITGESGYFGFDIGLDFYDKVRFSIKAIAQNKDLFGSSTRVVLERSRRPEVRAYHPGEEVFVGASTLKPALSDNSVNTFTDGLPTVINIETGFILPDIEINEHRKFVDYYKFQSYNVTQDVEVELDKGDFTTDLYGYLLEKGYDVVLDGGSDDSGSEALYINGFKAYVYAHTQNKLRDLDYESRDLTIAPSGIAASIDMRDIKSVVVYDRPMYQREAWDLSPLYLEHLNKTIDLEKVEQLNSNAEQSAGVTRVFMVDLLLKEEHEIRAQESKIQQNQRFTTIDGYSRPYSFYAPEYPTGPIIGDVDYRRTLYWNPNVITNEDGFAQVEFYNNSITEHFNVEAAGITASGTPYILEQGF